MRHGKLQDVVNFIEISLLIKYPVEDLDSIVTPVDGVYEGPVMPVSDNCKGMVQA